MFRFTLFIKYGFIKIWDMQRYIMAVFSIIY